MADLTLAPPATQKMTYEAYSALPQAGQLIEWVDGEIVYHMPPLLIHQEVTGFLYTLLSFFVHSNQLGQVFIAPTEMRCTPEGNAREPDLMVIATANLARLKDGRRVNGPADLVVEVVSDDSVGRDYDEKFIEYQACGVQEYWIVDPRPRRSRALFYQRGADGLFEAVNPHKGLYRVQVVPGFWLRPAWLWERPNPQMVLSEIMKSAE